VCASWVMARKRTKLSMSQQEMAQVKQGIRSATDARDKERLQVVLWATSGQHSLQALAELAGRARSTIQIWLDDFTEGGLTKLLEREAPPGKPSPVAEPKIQEQLQAGLKAGHWRTAGQVAAWLKEAHGIERAAKSLYYWLGKVGGALRVPRPSHVKQDPAATAAFRAELEANLEKLGLAKDRPVKIWVADEARFGLHTQSRRCWADRRQRHAGRARGHLGPGGVSSAPRECGPASAHALAAAAALQSGTQPGGGAVGSNPRRDLQPALRRPGPAGGSPDPRAAPLLGNADAGLVAGASLAARPIKRYRLTHSTASQ
jgi:transposase